MLIEEANGDTQVRVHQMSKEQLSKWKRDTALMNYLWTTFGPIPELTANAPSLVLRDMNKKSGRVVFGTPTKSIEYRRLDSNLGSPPTLSEIGRREGYICKDLEIQPGTYVDLPIGDGRVRYGVPRLTWTDANYRLDDGTVLPVYLNFFSQTRYGTHRREKSMVGVKYEKGEPSTVRFTPRTAFPILVEDEASLPLNMRGIEIASLEPGRVHSFDYGSRQQLSIEKVYDSLSLQLTDSERGVLWQVDAPAQIDQQAVIEQMTRNRWQLIPDIAPVSCYVVPKSA